MSAPAPEPWHGACRTEPRLFDAYWDDETESPRALARRLKTAAATCRTCPMLHPCRRALDDQTEPVSGVWAGVIINFDGKTDTTRPGYGAAA